MKSDEQVFDHRNIPKIRLQLRKIKRIIEQVNILLVE
jgi:hypothetical protein